MERKPLRTVIIGGGRGCRAIVRLALGGFLRELPLDVRCVHDPDNDAPGMQFARENEIYTTTDFAEAMRLPNAELFIELTGRDEVLEELYRIIPSGTKLIDHATAHIFWDLLNAQEEQKRQLIEKTELERKIESERQFLQQLFDSLPDLAVVLGRDREILRINRSFAEFVGRAERDVIGMTCQEILAHTPLAEQCRRSEPGFDDVIRDARPQMMVWYTAPPNEAYWEVTRKPLLNSEGEVETVLATWHRITEQVRLQREIQSAEYRFRSFIDSAHDWISIKDLEGRYLIVNPVIARAFHRAPEDFVGKRPEDILPESLARTIKQHDLEVLRDNSYHTYEEQVEIDGRAHYFQTVRFPLFDYEGTVTGTCTIMRDISRERELRDQLVQAEKLGALGKLAAGVAHEINNPLTGILAYAEDMLDDIPEDSPHQVDLKVIIRETLRCRDIVRNLLDFARQDAPKLSRLKPTEVVDQALSLVERLPQFHNIRIEKEIGRKIPDIMGDTHQLSQVLLNLMLNASDAMKGKGTIYIGIDYDRRARRCVISVEDTGPGIPENLIDKVFEPFFSTKGTNGLGLAVSWGIVERHKGEIEIDMGRAGGAVFRIVLPAVAA
jgi:two-component system, NtrC family, sensor kinase